MKWVTKKKNLNHFRSGWVCLAAGASCCLRPPATGWRRPHSCCRRCGLQWVVEAVWALQLRTTTTSLPLPWGYLPLPPGSLQWNICCRTRVQHREVTRGSEWMRTQRIERLFKNNICQKKKKTKQYFLYNFVYNFCLMMLDFTSLSVLLWNTWTFLMHYSFTLTIIDAL